MHLRPGGSSAHHAMEARIDEELSQMITQVTNEINWHLHQQKLSRADLANLMGVSPGRVSQVLSGGENLTLRTLASLATALDARFDMTLRELEPVAPGETGRQLPALKYSAAEDDGPLRPTNPSWESRPLSARR